MAHNLRRGSGYKTDIRIFGDQRPFRHYLYLPDCTWTVSSSVRIGSSRYPIIEISTRWGCRDEPKVSRSPLSAAGDFLTSKCSLLQFLNEAELLCMAWCVLYMAVMRHTKWSRNTMYGTYRCGPALPSPNKDTQCTLHDNTHGSKHFTCQGAAFAANLI